LGSTFLHIDQHNNASYYIAIRPSLQPETPLQWAIIRKKQGRFDKSAKKRYDAYNGQKKAL